MEIKTGKSFDSLAQRVVYELVATFPDFVPAQVQDEHGNFLDALAQEAAWKFLRDTAGRFFDDPGLLGLPLVPDDALDDWAFQNSKPELVNAMRRYSKKMEGFYQDVAGLFQAGTISGQILDVPFKNCKMSPQMQKRLAALGFEVIVREGPEGKAVCLALPEYPGALAALGLLATLCSADKVPALRFARGIFDPELPLLQTVFARLMGGGENMELLASYFASHGYSCAQYRDGRIVLDWYKAYGSKDEPLKTAWASRIHGGLSLTWDTFRKNQVAAALRIPEFKVLLEHWESLAPAMKDFVLGHTKKCDGCRYCVQTDKTGTKPLAAVRVEHGAEFSLCPLFPGFGYVWRYLDAPLVDLICSWSDQVDGVLLGECLKEGHASKV